MQSILKVLIIEDDTTLCEMLQFQFKNRNIISNICTNGKSGKKELENNYDIILLDLMLPDIDGIEILREIRENNIKTPVIIISAISDFEKRIEGLDDGADDYVTKPFEFNELLARINAVIRRVGLAQKELSYADILFNLYTSEVKCNNQVIRLTKKESDLLTFLLKNKENIISREDIINYVWGNESFNEDGNLDNYMYFLRKRLNKIGSSIQIKTIRSKGYILCKADHDK